MQVEADDSRGGISRYWELCEADRVHCEEIAMGMVTLRRARATIARSTKIGTHLQGTGREFATGRSPGAHL